MFWHEDQPVGQALGTPCAAGWSWAGRQRVLSRQSTYCWAPGLFPVWLVKVTVAAALSRRVAFCIQLAVSLDPRPCLARLKARSANISALLRSRQAVPVPVPGVCLVAITTSAVGDLLFFLQSPGPHGTHSIPLEEGITWIPILQQVPGNSERLSSLPEGTQLPE